MIFGYEFVLDFNKKHNKTLLFDFEFVIELFSTINSASNSEVIPEPNPNNEFLSIYLFEIELVLLNKYNLVDVYFVSCDPLLIIKFGLFGFPTKDNSFLFIFFVKTL